MANSEKSVLGPQSNMRLLATGQQWCHGKMPEWVGDSPGCWRGPTPAGGVGAMRGPWWWQLENANVTGLPRSIMCGQFPQTTQYNALDNDDSFAKHFPPTVMHVLDIFPWLECPSPNLPAYSYSFVFKSSSKDIFSVTFFFFFKEEWKGWRVKERENYQVAWKYPHPGQGLNLQIT